MQCISKKRNYFRKKRKFRKYTGRSSEEHEECPVWCRDDHLSGPDTHRQGLDMRSSLLGLWDHSNTQRSK